MDPHENGICMKDDHILRRLDFALVPVHRPSCEQQDATSFVVVYQCQTCETPLEHTEFPRIQWCPSCRHIFCNESRYVFGALPPDWQQDRFFAYWHRGMTGARNNESDCAFAKFFCDRVGVDLAQAMRFNLVPSPDLSRIGRLALIHHLLSRQEVAWVLRCQRMSRPHLRRGFGEIAVALGFWEPTMSIRLLALQAERRRGLAPAIACAFKVPQERILLAEKSFFGLCADAQDATPGLDRLMAA